MCIRRLASDERERMHTRENFFALTERQRTCECYMWRSEIESVGRCPREKEYLEEKNEMGKSQENRKC